MEHNRDNETEDLLSSCQEAASSREENEAEAVPSISDKACVPFEIVVFVIFLGRGSFISTLQFYVFDDIAKRYGGVNVSSHAPCSNSSQSEVKKTVEAEVAKELMYLSFVGTLLAVVPTLVIGSYSDKIGRKFALLLSIGCSCLRWILILVVFVLDLSAEFLYIGNAIEALSGGNGALVTACYGIVADITPPNTMRAFRITSVDFVRLSSVSLAIVISGFWLKVSGYLQPMIFFLSLNVVALFCVVFCIPESYSARRRSQGSEQSLGPLVKKTFQLYIEDTPNRRRWKLCILLLVYVIAICTGNAEGSVTVLYLLDAPFCWPELDISVYKASCLFVGLCSGLACIRGLGNSLKEAHVAVVGCLSSFFTNVLFGAASSSAFIYVAGVVGLLRELVAPMIRSSMSRLVSADEQGALFASMGVMDMLLTSADVVVTSSVYRSTLGIYPGLIFFVFAFSSSLKGLLFVIYIRKSSREEELVMEASID